MAQHDRHCAFCVTTIVVVVVVVVVVVDNSDDVVATPVMLPRQLVPTQREPILGLVVTRVDTRLAAPSSFAAVSEGV